MRHDAHGFDGFRNEVARTHDVADFEAGCELDVDLACLELGGSVEVVGAKTGVSNAPPAAGICGPAGLDYGFYCICAGLRAIRGDGEENGLSITGRFAGEVGFSRFGVPACG